MTLRGVAEKPAGTGMGWFQARISWLYFWAAPRAGNLAEAASPLRRALPFAGHASKCIWDIRYRPICTFSAATPRTTSVSSALEEPLDHTTVRRVVDSSPHSRLAASNKCWLARSACLTGYLCTSAGAGAADGDRACGDLLQVPLLGPACSAQEARDTLPYLVPSAAPLTGPAPSVVPWVEGSSENP
ncbi:uncharacterized protein E0L32_000617 [Thyridium curvatum]|uniref:Uncharacterized protein n=1 Tax=Thyridium curvatum TaxID=1093900 RepID=A0A507B2Y5_9PEZI|nr:uncharacterized protein E0L32_000617 [Thyridium curvatum]TPX14223.1 hypothetical protein E0L32_000617 [Thyridium curvatum]